MILFFNFCIHLSNPKIAYMIFKTSIFNVRYLMTSVFSHQRAGGGITLMRDATNEQKKLVSERTKTKLAEIQFMKRKSNYNSIKIN